MRADSRICVSHRRKRLRKLTSSLLIGTSNETSRSSTSNCLYMTARCCNLVSVVVFVMYVQSNFINYNSVLASATAVSSSSIKSKIIPSGTKKKHQPALVSTATISTNKKKNKAWINGLKNGICSAGASACSKTLLQPIDAIKTMQQYYQQQAQGSTTGSALSIWGACKEIYYRVPGQSGSINNFYSGLYVNVIGAIPSVAIYFSVYSYCKTKLLASKYGKTSPLLCIATSAAIGNTIASFSRVPYEVIKQQLQTGIYTSTYDALKSILQNKNGMILNMIFPKGGIAIQMIRDVPYAVVTLLVYESLQTKFNKQSTTSTLAKKVKQSTTKSSSEVSTSQNNNKNNKKIIDFIVGGIAGGIGSYVTNPMDVIKTRLQINSSAYNGSVLVCTKQLYAEGGIITFLRGSIPRLVHKVPANAFFFFFYELFRKLLNVE